jgi:hypothetical protein
MKSASGINRSEKKESNTTHRIRDSSAQIESE